MSRPKITLFVDIVSPFAYIGFYALQVRQSDYADLRQVMASLELVLLDVA